MIGLHLSQVRLALPVTGALVVGVGVGSAIAWVAGGAGNADPHEVTARATVAATATTMSALSVGRVQDARAVGLLERAAVARTAIPWSGTQVITTWTPDGTSTRIVDLSHEPGSGTAVGVHATPAQSQVRTFVPDTTAAPSAELGSGPLFLLTRAYTLRAGEIDVVAGRKAQQVMAIRTDGSVAARFWLDQSTGLLLRRELLDPKGSVTHSSVFVSVRPGEAGDVDPDGEVTTPWSGEIGQSQLAAMGAGWLCPQQIGSLTLYDVRRTTDGDDPVVHFAYSDGLVTVSVFEERGQLSARSLKGYVRATLGGRQVNSRSGTAEALTWQSGPMVYTVVADAPRETLAAVVAALPDHETAQPGTWTRVHHGLNRMGSWVDPRG